MSFFHKADKDADWVTTIPQGSDNHEEKLLDAASISTKSDTFAKILDLLIKFKIVSVDCHPKLKNVNESYLPPNSVRILRLLCVLLFMIVIWASSCFLIKARILSFPVGFTGMILIIIVFSGYTYIQREKVYKETGFDRVPLGFFIIVCSFIVPLYGGIMYIHFNKIKWEQRDAIMFYSLLASIAILIMIGFCALCFTCQLRKWTRQQDEEKTITV
ncbi:unnamed protein product [Orchesella dallaii]|uniref:Transmembrane protein n=1 Tax=Orchesella dallaii TaxID=48710 RepID=A0ABP1RZ84_9HEXA